MAAKPPEPLRLCYRLQMWLRGVCPLLSSCLPTPNQDPPLHNPHHFWQSEVPPPHIHWSCWHSLRRPVCPWLSQFCLSPDTKHPLFKPFFYRTDPSPENLSLAIPHQAVPPAKALSTEHHHSPEGPETPSWPATVPTDPRHVPSQGDPEQGLQIPATIPLSSREVFCFSQLPGHQAKSSDTQRLTCTPVAP